MGSRPKHPIRLVERLSLWERQPDETDNAWLAFICYRDMGVKRTHQRVADATKQSLSHINTLSHRNFWRRRLEAYENHLDGIRREEHEKVIRETSRQHAMISQTMLAVALKKLSTVTAAELTVKEAIMMVRAAIPTHREAQGVDRLWRPAALPPVEDDDLEDEGTDD